MSNIFSPNYSVGTALCTLQCPGSRMAWWVTACAKLRPLPHCPPAGLPVLALVHVWDHCPGLTLLAWQADSPVSGLVQGQFHWTAPSVWTCLLLISVIPLWMQSRWRIPQLCTNLSSCEVCDLPLDPADAPGVAPRLRDASGFLRCSRPAPGEAWARQRNKAPQLGRRSLAKTPTEKKAAARATRAFWNVLCGPDSFSSLESLWLTHEWVRCLPAYFFCFLRFRQTRVLGERLHYFKS